RRRVETRSASALDPRAAEAARISHPALPDGNAGCAASLEKSETDRDARVAVNPGRRLNPAAEDARVVFFVGQIRNSRQQATILGEIVFGSEVESPISGYLCRDKNSSVRTESRQVRILEELRGDRRCTEAEAVTLVLTKSERRLQHGMRCEGWFLAHLVRDI